MDLYQQQIGVTKYQRYSDVLKRRETWPEAVSRYMTTWNNEVSKEEAAELQKAITDLEVMPSMRSLMTAGPALERDNVAGFNCAFLPIDHPRAFDETLYILMCGTGVGYSVEQKYIDQLPEVAETFYKTDTVIKVRDSKKGWAKSVRELLSLLWAGQIPDFDVSDVRPSGARLKVFGGRASGPEPLVDLFHFSCRLFKNAAGRNLTDLECHDLCTKIADIVVVGGVRRSALICLSDLNSDRMRRAKSGDWWNEHGHRRLANNSACYIAKPELPEFLHEWTALYESYSGERGVFSRVASQKQAAKNGRRDATRDFGTNPCSEIILRPNQFCNLSEVVIRKGDTLQSLKRKVRIATILGTLQSTLTDFQYIRKIWQKNTEEERLLGVSLTGIMDHEVMSGQESPKKLKKWLNELRDEAIAVNLEWSQRLGISQSTAITCVKPSGTVSQLVNSASGIHPRYDSYYIRRIQSDTKDPMCQVMKDHEIPWEEYRASKGTVVFEFPQKAEGLVTKDMGAMAQLELWKMYQDEWCEHKPSMTCFYTPDEFLDVGAWLYRNFDDISGISFLPLDTGIYQQAPYEAITEEEYNKRVSEMPKEINWYVEETEDNTTGAQTLACVSGVCDI